MSSILLAVAASLAAPPSPSPWPTCPDTTGKRINIGCVGDSITAGAHSSGGMKRYPEQLLELLENQTSTKGKYCVTNMGESGSTMQKSPHGDSPYWKRNSFKTLSENKWDIVVIMLGTNDAKDACGQPASYCKANVNGSCCNWPHSGQTNWTQDCSNMDCPFVTDYNAMVSLVKTLGTTAAGPVIYTAIPPPLMTGGSPGSPTKPYGMNQTIINDFFPALIPKINAANKLPHPTIDVFSALGGSANLECGFGAQKSFAQLCDHKCVASAHDPACIFQCDAQSCDPCHPNDVGYTALAKAVLAGLVL